MGSPVPKKTVCTSILLNAFEKHTRYIEHLAYSGIGRDKLYELTNPEDCPFVLWIGNRRMIKRKKFDEYIERQYSI